MAEKVKLLEIIQRTDAGKLPGVPEIAKRFKKMFQIVHGKNARVEAFYEAEKFHFMKMIQDNPKLAACTKMSLYGCWMDVAVNGLSFDPSFKHLYLVPFNNNVGTRDNPQWETRAQLQISGYGELVLRIKQGQIKYADNPVLVYESDKFSYGVRGQDGFVEHEAIIPRTSKKIIACYVKLTRHDDTVDFKVITEEDIERFKAYAKKDSSGNLSKAWTDGEGGMWQSKCIKHAFKNYAKIRTGEFSQLDTQTVDETAEVVETSMRVPDKISYMDEEDDTDIPAAGSGITAPVDDNSFVGTKKEEPIIKKDDDAF